MRITNNMIQRQALDQLQSGYRKISAAERQVSTGLRLQQASDDPAAASSAVHTRGSLRALDQYRRNIDSAGSRATAEESVLDQLTDALIRAKELGLSQRSGTASASTRAITKAEVDQLLTFAVQLGNTRHGEEYLFGGQWAEQAPFDPEAADFLPRDPVTNQARLPDGARQTEIYTGQYLVAGHNGKQVFLDSGALQAIKDLAEAMESPDPETAIANALTGLDGALDAVQRALGETGARANQLQVTSANLDALDINLKTLKSSLEEVDLEVAVTELVSRQTSFQAAMLATSRVMGLTLADYLR